MIANARNTRPIKLTEKDVTRVCKDYLELRQWHMVRINAGPFGAPGQPDYFAVRYRKPADVIWVEFKGGNGRIGPKQKLWIEAERLRGATVWVVSDISELIDLYEDRYGVEGQLRLEGRM